MNTDPFFLFVSFFKPSTLPKIMRMNAALRIADTHIPLRIGLPGPRAEPPTGRAAEFSLQILRWGPRRGASYH
ncbi:MAG: hypothetical protein KIT09_24740 [Bryobacteraceae bacterium]|nr:hypothetical protein [Bryobacteraceae bacterium]